MGDAERFALLAFETFSTLTQRKRDLAYSSLVKSSDIVRRTGIEPEPARRRASHQSGTVEGLAKHFGELASGHVWGAFQ